jgi:hypothetical protein
VAVEESHDIEDVSKFYFLLVPRRSPDTEGKLNLDAPAAPASAPQDSSKSQFRQIAIGKKRLPDTEAKHEVFWATVVNVGDDLEALESGLEEQVYQTKTRGIHDRVQLVCIGIYFHLQESVTFSLPA